MGLARNLARLIPNNSGELPTANIAANAIVEADIANSAVTLAKLSASGTKDATTYLRGDNTFATVSAIVKKISTYEYSTRTNPSTSVQSVFSWTSSFTMIDRVNNSLLVMAWVPTNDSQSADYTGYGLRFTNGTTNYDTQGRGSNYVGRPSGDLAMSIQQYGFWVPANSVPTGTLTLQHYLYTGSSNALICPNSGDDGRLNQTVAQLIITEYGT
jgi:hypothetical protein